MSRIGKNPIPIPSGVTVKIDGDTAHKVTLAAKQRGRVVVPVSASGAGNITGDPLLVDLTAGDYRLTEVSPCRDTGDTALIYWPSDLENNPRVQGDAVDMGAYEFQIPGGSVLIVR